MLIVDGIDDMYVCNLTQIGTNNKPKNIIPLNAPYKIYITHSSAQEKL